MTSVGPAECTHLGSHSSPWQPYIPHVGNRKTSQSFTCSDEDTVLAVSPALYLSIKPPKHEMKTYLCLVSPKPI